MRLLSNTVFLGSLRMSSLSRTTSCSVALFVGTKEDAMQSLVAVVQFSHIWWGVTPGQWALRSTVTDRPAVSDRRAKSVAVRLTSTVAAVSSSDVAQQTAMKYCRRGTYSAAWRRTEFDFERRRPQDVTSGDVTVDESEMEADMAKCRDNLTAKSEFLNDIEWRWSSWRWPSSTCT